MLDAHPDTEESKAALVEEIKNRARCVAGGLEKGGRERGRRMEPLLRVG